MEEQKKEAPMSEFAEDFMGDESSRTILERLQRAGRPAASQAEDELARCPDCGSSWFAELQFQQYRANVYSYGPGGDLQVASPTSIPVRFCLCGRVLEPNITTQGVGRGTLSRLLDSFHESLSQASQWRSSYIDRSRQAITVAEMKPRDELLADVKSFVDKLRKRLAGERQGGRKGPADEPAEARED